MADTIITGTNGSDTLTGTSGSDTISGGNGNDTISGGAGNDTIYGGNGGDTLNGGSGADTVYGEKGNDILIDKINDNIDINNTALFDYYDGGSGTDTLNFIVTARQQATLINSGAIAAFTASNKSNVFDFQQYVSYVHLKVVDIESVTFTIIADSAPIALADATATGEKTGLAINVLANDYDPDLGDTLSLVSATTTTPGVAVSINNGQVQYNPGTHFAYLSAGESTTDTFTYTIRDPDGLTSMATVTMTINGVNDAPILATLPQASATANAVQQINAVAAFTDVDHLDTHTISVDNSGIHYGTLAASISLDTNTASSITLPGNLHFTYDPTGKANAIALAQGETTLDTFSYTINDGHGGSVTKSITIQLTGVNDAPVAVNDGQVASTTTDTGITILGSTLLANDSDVDHGAILSISPALQGPHANLFSVVDGNIVFNPGEELTYIAPGESQQIAVYYRVVDEFGALSNTPALATVLVTGVNHAPVAINDGQVASTDENTGITILGSTLLANDTDVDYGHILSIDSVNGDSHVALVNGNVVFTPGTDFQSLAQGETATVNFSYVAKDEFGALSNPATASILVTGTNDAPVAVNDGQLLGSNENAVITFLGASLLANDTDVDHGAILSIASVSGDSHFSVVNGDVVFTPGTDFKYLNAGDTLQLDFYYRTMDQFGAVSSTAAFGGTLFIAGINDAPVAVNDGQVASTGENTGITILGSTLLANDTDVDSNHILSMASVNGDSHVALVNGNVVFTPGTDFQYLNQGETATVNFSYVAKDEFGALSNSATASILVTGVNNTSPNNPVSITSAPTAVYDLANGSVTFKVGFADSDAGDIHSVTLGGTTLGTASATVNEAQHTVSFTYNETASGLTYSNGIATLQDQLSYTISDNHGSSASGGIAIGIVQPGANVVINGTAGNDYLVAPMSSLQLPSVTINGLAGQDTIDLSNIYANLTPGETPTSYTVDLGTHPLLQSIRETVIIGDLTNPSDPNHYLPVHITNGSSGILQLSGDASLDLSKLGPNASISNIGTIDLNASGNNQLVMSGPEAQGLNGSHVLIINGSSGDSVTLLNGPVGGGLWLNDPNDFTRITYNEYSLQAGQYLITETLFINAPLDNITVI